MTATPTDSPAASTTRPALWVLAAVAPALAALAIYPGFVTQDGPAHLYNAHILACSFDPASPFRDVFSVRWEPLPNWAGHLALMGLVTTLPPRAADRVMTALTLVGFALALGRLRGRVAGARGSAPAAVLAALLALNVTWLFGFTSFLIGASLFPLTLGFWWSGRGGGFSARRAGALAMLATLGYFCHLVSLGLTALGLLVLEVWTPGPRRVGRAATSILGLSPLAPLALVYLRLMRRGGGGFEPQWKHLADLGSARSWVAQLGWVDPLSLARKDVLPLVDGFASPWCGLLAPAVWLAAGLVLAIVGTCAAGLDRERRGWWLLAILLIVGGIVTPDTLGPRHGEYLPQRVVLLGLAALVPVLRFDSRLGRAASWALFGALVLQSATVWDYARASDRTAGRLLRAGPMIGQGRRVATLLAAGRARFRANPLLHADCALGVGTGNVIWADYEALYYYFPVHFRDGLDRPDPRELEAIALMTDAGQLAARALRWGRLLAAHRGAIDVVVAWNPDPALDAVNEREGFVLSARDGPVRVWTRGR